MKVFLNLIAIGLFVCIMGGCASMDNDWKMAKTKNSVMGYREFIKQYPESQYAGEAKSGIDKLDYESACRDDSISSYERYLKKHSNGNFVEDAREKLMFKQAQAEFDKAVQKDTIEGYELFVKNYPDTLYIDQAKGAIKQLQEKQDRLQEEFFNQAMKRKDYISLKTYCNKFPDGKHLEQVKEMLKNFDWEKADNDTLLIWEKLGYTGVMEKNEFDKALSKTRLMRVIKPINGELIAPFSETIFLKSGATNEVEYSKPYKFCASPLSEEGFIASSLPGGYLLYGFLDFKHSLIIPVGSEMVLTDTPTKNSGSGKSSTSNVTATVVSKEFGASTNTTYNGTARISEGVCFSGLVCRNGIVKVVEEGLELKKGVEILRYKEKIN